MRTNAKLAVGYLRVSTDAETQELGLEAQRAAVIAWAAREGIQIASWFQDEVSGGSSLDQRPGLMSALDSVRTLRAGMLVVQKRDRFTRDARQTAPVDLALEKLGARVVAADGAGNGTDPSTELMRGMLDAFSRFERAQIAQRTKAALSVKRGRGERISRHVPYGSQLSADGKHLEPNMTEQAIVVRMKALRASGLILREVASTLAKEGHLNRAGNPFNLSTIHGLLA